MPSRNETRRPRTQAQRAAERARPGPRAEALHVLMLPDFLGSRKRRLGAMADRAQRLPRDPEFEARVRDSFARQRFMTRLRARLAAIARAW
jgi:hypothetical protein